ncbi:MAG: ABC transporter permease [Candidatus Nanoarchaeia archaeon]
MNKFFSTIKKNIKILLRMKTSLISIIIGPLLIVFLIGFAFNSPSGVDLSVGYFAPDDSAMTQEFITSIQETYTTQSFSTNEECFKQVQKGFLHACIIFPIDFSIKDSNQPTIQFVVDTSRTNIAYEIIDTVSDQIGVKTDELSKELISVITTTLTSSKETMKSQASAVDNISQTIQSSLSTTTDISTQLNNIQFDTQAVNISYQNDTIILQNYTSQLTTEIETFYSSYSGTLSPDADSALSDLHSFALNTTINSTIALNTLDEKISDANEALLDWTVQMTSAQDVAQDSKTAVHNLQSSLQSIQSQLTQISSELQNKVTAIENIKITSSSAIADPVETEIITVSAHNSNLLILFPYVVMLVILFVGMMLASTLVVVEKRNRARFRVFSTPTNEEFFIATTIVTTILVILLQLLITFSITQLLFVDILSANVLVHSIILLASAITFAVIGMVIGLISSTQQAVNMITIFFGAGLLFLSNMVLPLESVSAALQKIASYNPYVISSELFRQSLLFSSSLKDLLGSLCKLGIITGILLLIIILSQGISQKKFFTKQHKRKGLPKTTYLRIKDYIVINDKDLLIALQHVNDEEFDEFIKQHKKKFKKFLKKQLRYKKLSKKVGKESFDRKDLLIELATIHKEYVEKLQKYQKKFQQQAHKK